MSLTEEELLARMDRGLLDMALADIKWACKPGEQEGAKMAGFLLGFCFIDATSGFHAGRTKQNMKGNNRKHFTAFVMKHMPGYQSGLLYDDLRNGLVHGYTIGDTYAFAHLERDGKHFETKTTGFGMRTLLNLEDFVSDIEKAYNSLREAIRTEPTQFQKALARYESMGLLTVA
jgi:hypothetical protein